MYALYVLCIPKGTCWAEATSNSEKMKPVALANIELHLSEGIRQVIGWAVFLFLYIIMLVNPCISHQTKEWHHTCIITNSSVLHVNTTQLSVAE